jgi:hypothetical protein
MHQIQAERGIGGINHHFRQLGIFLILLVIPVILFWRRDLFFILDDWTLILQMSDGNSFWQFSIMPDCEMIMPISRFIYYIMILLFGVHYSWLILINCLITGLNTFLLYLIFSKHFKPNLALSLSILYAIAGVHGATAQMAYYISALLCLNFFLLSLLLTQIYVRQPSTLSLLGIGLFAWLSVNSWNFSLLGIWTLPIYATLFWETGTKRHLLGLIAVIGLVFLGFTAEYFIFNLAGATCHNSTLFSQFFSFSFLSHWFVGSFLAPLVFLFHLETSRVAKVLISLAIFVSTAGLIMWVGNLSEKKLCLWALVLNALPFLLVSLARHHFHVEQAFSDRYGIFTIIGSLFILGTTWQIIAAKLPARPGLQVVLPLAILAVMTWGQVHTIPKASRLYLKLSQEARSRYNHLGDEEFRAQLAAAAVVNQPFFNLNQPIAVHPFLTNAQALAIHRYLSGLH